MDIREPEIRQDEILMPRALSQSISAEGEGKICSFTVSCGFSKYLVGGDLLFDGGMVLTY